MRPGRASTVSALFLVWLLSLGAGASDLNDAGTAAYHRGDYAEAERIFGQAIDRTPSEPLLHYHRGVALSRLSRWREAAASYEAALRLRPPAGLAASIKDGLRSLAPFLGEPTARGVARQEMPIPLKSVAGGWLAEVVVNDTRRARFLVDTGASICVIGPDLARELGIAPEPGARTIHLETVSGQTSGPLVSIPTLRVGETEAEDVPGVILDLGPRMDGILGNTFLGRYIVTVDPARGVLTLKPR
jgi:clan AA aspartic protease (TIGR02281 family)